MVVGQSVRFIDARLTRTCGFLQAFGIADHDTFPRCLDQPVALERDDRPVDEAPADAQKRREIFLSQRQFRRARVIRELQQSPAAALYDRMSAVARVVPEQTVQQETIVAENRGPELAEVGEFGDGRFKGRNPGGSHGLRWRFL